LLETSKLYSVSDWNKYVLSGTQNVVK